MGKEFQASDLASKPEAQEQLKPVKVTNLFWINKTCTQTWTTEGCTELQNGFTAPKRNTGSNPCLCNQMLSQALVGHSWHVQKEEKQ